MKTELILQLCERILDNLNLSPTEIQYVKNSFDELSDNIASQFTPVSDGADFVEWCVRNQFSCASGIWTSTEIYYSGCCYRTTELYTLFKTAK